MKDININDLIKNKSIIKNNPYFTIAKKYDNKDIYIDSERVTRCKYCGEAHSTLYKLKDGNYICDSCKILGIEEDN